MNIKEREDLKKIDELVLGASSKELEKIQEIDQHAQMEGLSFYDVYNSSSLINQRIKKPTREY